MKNLISIIFMLVGFVGLTQQDAMYTHYGFNTLVVNPAYSGSREVLTGTLLHRSQWVGFEGAPTTQTLTLHGPLKNNRLGLGLSIENDKIGPTASTSMYSNVSYNFNLTGFTKLSLGLKLGGDLFQRDLLSVSTKVSDNKFFANGSDFLVNAGLGVYVYHERFYAGFSVPKLIENSYGNGIGDIQKRHFFAIAGFVKRLNSGIKLKPTTFLKATEGAPLELDLSTMLLFKNNFELGIMYRTFDAVGILAGYNFSKNMRLGYSFDWSFENTSGIHNLGSHELMIRYDFISLESERIHSPRYF